MENKIDRQELSPLPFNYKRTFDPTKASYQEWRVSPVSIVGRENKPRTDSEIISMVIQQREQKDWFVNEYWRKKGLPSEQIEFMINGSPITVYNWNKELPFTEQHIQKTKDVLEELGSRFPKILNSLRWILVENYQEPSLLGDPIKYPASGHAMSEWNTFRLFPKGMSIEPYRMPPIPNFVCTLTHELAHLIEKEFEAEWEQNFQWGYCWDSDEWESRDSPDGNGKKFFNKKTGEMSPQFRFPLQPEQCVTYYAKQNPSEDICESLTSYVLKPDLLEKVSPKKLEILKSHDVKLKRPEVSFKTILVNQIRLPEIKPEVVYYFIKEPNP